MEPQIPIEAGTALNATLHGHGVVHNSLTAYDDDSESHDTLLRNNIFAIIFAVLLFAIFVCCLYKCRSVGTPAVLTNPDLQSDSHQRKQDVEDPSIRLAYIRSHLQTRSFKICKPQDDLPTNEDASNNKCIICLNEFKPSDVIGFSQNPSCNHIFHKQCIASWLTTQKECPLCRRTFFCEGYRIQTEEKRIRHNGDLQQEQVTSSSSVDSFRETEHTSLSIEDQEGYCEESDEDEQQVEYASHSPPTSHLQEENEDPELDPEV